MRKFSLNTLAFAVGVAITHYASAQSQPVATDEQSETSKETLEEVVVTGSRIKRDSFSVAMPMMTVDKESIESTGSNALTDTLLEIPSIVSGVSQSNSISNLQNAGLSSVDLRNLGDNRTLVLIDGRRTVSNSANGNRVSLGTIPSRFVERVEVITGGASAIYGSDAVAGVVNIITETDQEGFAIEGRYGEGRDGAYDDRTLDISFGSTFDNDKGYFFAALNYDDESGIRAQDVDLSLLQANWRYRNGVNEFETFDGFQPADQVTRDQYANLSSDPDGGRFLGGDYWYDDNGLRENFVTNVDGFDSTFDDDILTPRERINFAFKINYTLDNDIEVFSQFIYSKVDSESTRNPEGVDYNDLSTRFNPDTGFSEFISAGRISLDNPFVPQAIAADASSRGITWDRRFVEVGLQHTVNDRETTRFWTGLRGKVFDDWGWETSIGYGRYEQDQMRFNEINILNLTQGLNVESVAGVIQCADAQARANGCVPVNLFGRGSITPEAADYIRADLGLESEIEQINVIAFMSGKLIDLPAGPLGFATGFEYREDKMALLPDELNRNGGHSSGFVPAFSARADVAEVFAEVSIPLLKDLPGIDRLDWDLSVRVAEYSQETVDRVTSFGTAIQWRPISELNIRTSYNRALRAPDLAELNSPPRGDSDSFDDICNGVTLTSVGVVDDNCRAEPGVLALIQQEGEFDDESRSKSSPNAGNDQLFEETAETVTAGFVWQPDYIEGFSLASDYYSIKIEDAIDDFTNEEIMRQCYESVGNFGDQNPFCADITRDSDGQISQLIQRQANLRGLETSGVDTSARYNFKLSSIGIPGKFDITYIHSHLIEFRELAQGNDGSLIIDDKKGELVSDNFEDRSQLKLGWKYNDFRTTWRVRYFSSISDDNDLKDEYREALAENPNAEKPLYLDIGSETVHDFYAAYTLKTDGINYRFYGGIRNVFDDEGPFLPDGTSGDTNQNSVYGILRGRYNYVGVRAKF